VEYAPGWIGDPSCSFNAAPPAALRCPAEGPLRALLHYARAEARNQARPAGICNEGDRQRNRPPLGRKSTAPESAGRSTCRRPPPSPVTSSQCAPRVPPSRPAKLKARSVAKGDEWRTGVAIPQLGEEHPARKLLADHCPAANPICGLSALFTQPRPPCFPLLRAAPSPIVWHRPGSLEAEPREQQRCRQPGNQGRRSSSRQCPIAQTAKSR